MKKSVIVVGGGASGMTAAIAAAREGADTAILEHTGRAGKKLLATGNGKCNLTNLNMFREAYRGEKPDFAWKVIEHMPQSDTLAFFESLGVEITDKNGYVYPRSGQASSVLNALMFELERLGIKIIYDCNVSRIGRDLSVITDQGACRAEAVILAAGSKAWPATGSDGSGYELVKKLGHHVVEPLPALVQLRCRERFYKQLAGVRAEGMVRLFIDGRLAAQDQGELQFTDYGISGIPVFQVSRFAARAVHQDKKVWAELDFLPHLEPEQVLQMLFMRKRELGHLPGAEFLNSVLNSKLAGVLLNNSRITGREQVRELKEEQLLKLAAQMKGFCTQIQAANSFDKAQVCSGGIDTGEICPDTMESRLVKGLFLAGEIVDVDGICGGYNLQWAWSSGILAGQSAARAQSDPGWRMGSKSQGKQQNKQQNKQQEKRRTV